MAKASLKNHSVIFCDDIRREDNGKLIFIGVYPEDIYPHKFPANLRLSLWVTSELESETSSAEYQLLVKPLSGGTPAEISLGKLEFGVTEDTPPDAKHSVNFALSNIAVKFLDESELVFRTRDKGGKWRKVASRLVKNPPDSSTENERPS